MAVASARSPLSGSTVLLPHVLLLSAAVTKSPRSSANHHSTTLPGNLCSSSHAKGHSTEVSGSVGSVHYGRENDRGAEANYRDVHDSNCALDKGQKILSFQHEAKQ